MKRLRRSRLRRLIRACMYLGRYPAAGAAALLLGCAPDPNVLSVSPDGRYVAVPVNAKGLVALEGEPALRCAVLDLQTGAVSLTDGLGAQAMWLTCAGGKVAMMTADKDKPTVLVHGDGLDLQIANAGYPALSPTGDKLAYLQAGEDDGGGPEQGLYLRDLGAGQTKLIQADGIVGTFSPDGSKLAYVAVKGGDDNEGLTLHVFELPTGQSKQVALLSPQTFDGGQDQEKSFTPITPCWIDNAHLLLATTGPDTGEDVELFITDLDGDLRRVTDNGFNEGQPAVTADGRLVYIDHDEAIAGGRGRGNGTITFAKRVGDKWEHSPTTIKAAYFKVLGNQVVCLSVGAAKDGGGASNARLFVADLDTGKETRDLGTAISAAAGK